MSKISIQDIAKAISSKHGLSQKDAEAFVSAFFDVINDGLHEEKSVKVKGLGTFKIVDVRERESVNVNTGERVVIESHGKITFTPDPVMRDLVNKPFAQFETVVLNEGVDVEELNSMLASDIQNDVILSDDDDDDVSVVEEMEVPVRTSASGNVKESKSELLSDAVAEAGSMLNEISGISSTDDEENNLEQPSLTVEETQVEENAATDDADISITSQIDPEPVVIEEPVEEEYSSNETSSVDSVSVDDETLDDVAVSEEHVSSADNTVLSSENEISSDESEHESKKENFILRRKYISLTILILFVSMASLIGGYYWGSQSVEPVTKYIKVRVIEKRAPTALPVDTVAVKDSVKTEENAEQEKETSLEQKQEGKPDKETVPESGKAVQPDASRALKSARTKVNTGAYRIVGTDRTVTVRKGQTLSQISKHYLGDGMECYIQVHNGIADVKEGMKINIPKLKIKR